MINLKPPGWKKATEPLPSVNPPPVDSTKPVENSLDALSKNASTLLSLPDTLISGGTFGAYHLVQPLKVTSAEADLWIVKDENDLSRILKFYRYGIVPKPEIMEALRQLNHEGVIKIVEIGETRGHYYEIQEFIEFGSLSSLMQKGKLSVERVREIVRQIGSAIEHLHSINVLHRDIKPSNILIRGITPFQIVLTDFGISSLADLSLHFTSVNRTAAYCAPEALTGVISKASDWWGVGMIALELLSGEHPFAGLNEQAINFYLVSKEVVIPDTIPAEWNQLIRGLLTRDYQHRWSNFEIQAWLGGRRDIPIHQMPVPIPSAPKKKATPYRFKQLNVETTLDLALVMAQDWNEAVKHFERGLITDWVQNQIHDQQLTNLLIDIGRSDLDPDLKLSAALLALHPELPLVYKGEIVTREWFTAQIWLGLHILRSSLPEWQEKLRNENWLLELRAQRRNTMTEIRHFSVAVDATVADALLLSDPARVIEYAKQQRAPFVDARNEFLKSLLLKPEMSFAEAVTFLACDKNLFLTASQIEEKKVSQLRKEVFEKLTLFELPYQWNKVNDFLLKDSSLVIREALAFRQNYPFSTNSLMLELLQKETLSTAEAIVMLACDQSLFMKEKPAPPTENQNGKDFTSKFKNFLGFKPKK